MRELLRETADLAADFLESLSERPVFPDTNDRDLRDNFGGAVPEAPQDPGQILADLAAHGGDAAVAIPGPRYLAAVQAGGVAWMSGSTWAGRQAIRISVSNWQTTEEDIDRTVAAFAAAV